MGIQIQRLEPAVVGSKTAKGPASILNFTVAKQGMLEENFTGNLLLYCIYCCKI